MFNVMYVGTSRRLELKDHCDETDKEYLHLQIWIQLDKMVPTFFDTATRIEVAEQHFIEEFYRTWSYRLLETVKIKSSSACK